MDILYAGKQQQQKTTTTTIQQRLLEYYNPWAESNIQVSYKGS